MTEGEWRKSLIRDAAAKIATVSFQWGAARAALWFVMYGEQLVFTTECDPGDVFAHDLAGLGVRDLNGCETTNVWTARPTQVRFQTKPRQTAPAEMTAMVLRTDRGVALEQRPLATLRDNNRRLRQFPSARWGRGGARPSIVEDGPS
jgi:hypothetical protein